MREHKRDQNGGVLFMTNNQNKPGTYTQAGTNIDEVKRNNANSGLTFNEVKQLIAKTVGSEQAEFGSVPNFQDQQKKK